MKKFLSLLTFLKNYRLLFCLAVFIFLILPFLFISKENISLQENRNLNKMPSIFSEKQEINERFGIEFNDWFSDRFGGRQFLINSRFCLLYLLNNRIANERAFMGDENWIFPTNGITKNIHSSKQYNKVIKIAKNIKKIDDYFDKKDVQIYLILEPSRSILYKKYWEKYYPDIPTFKYYKPLKEELNGRSNIHIIDLESLFEENKDKILLYEKNDSHMTIRALNIMLGKIVAAIDKTRPSSNFAKHFEQSTEYRERDCRLFPSLHSFDDYLKIKSNLAHENCGGIVAKSSQAILIGQEPGLRETIVSDPYVNNDLYILYPCYEEFVFPIMKEFFAHTISINYNANKIPDTKALKNKSISKLKSVKPGATVLIFIAYPTEYISQKTIDYLEAF